MAVKEMTDKYGEPNVAGDEMMVWHNAGNWHHIQVDKAETAHIFPVAHTDMLEQAVMYKVPLDKVDELAVFDGSVVFDRTQGLLSARCDKEGNNILALNLAHDIITGKKTVDEARMAYGTIVKEKLGGGDPAYMKKLNFSAQSGAADKDINTTGLDKMGKSAI